MNLRLLVVFAVLSSSCATTVVAGKTLGLKKWNEASDAVRTRGSFDLHCPADQLELTILAVDERQDWVPFATQIGVSGCAAQSVYVRTSSGWVANTSDKKE